MYEAIAFWLKKGMSAEGSRAKEKLIHLVARDFELINTGYLIHEILSRQSSPV